MSAFKYRFEKILKNKEHNEDEIKKKCDSARTLISLEKIKLNVAAEKEMLMRQTMLKNSSSGKRTIQDMNEIKSFHTYLVYLEEFMKRKKEQIAVLEAKLEGLHNELTAARVEKMTYEKIRERDEKVFGDTENRNEQKASDEYAVFKFRAQSAGLN
jgi:flagellar FliJ protein